MKGGLLGGRSARGLDNCAIPLRDGERVASESMVKFGLGICWILIGFLKRSADYKTGKAQPSNWLGAAPCLLEDWGQGPMGGTQSLIFLSILGILHIAGHNKSSTDAH